MEHRAFELDNRSFVWVLLRKFKGQLESACSHSASSLPNKCLHNEQGLSSSKFFENYLRPMECRQGQKSQHSRALYYRFWESHSRLEEGHFEAF